MNILIFIFTVIADIIIIIVTTEKLENNSLNNLLRKSMPNLTWNVKYLQITENIINRKFQYWSALQLFKLF